MISDLDLPRAQAAVAHLAETTPDGQLPILKGLCERDGVWTVPDDTSRFSPVLFEIQLFGVSAIANTADELPRNWMRAATNILNGEHTHPRSSPPLSTSSRSTAGEAKETTP